MGNQPIISGIRACVFDAYGTIFDLVSATDRLSASLGDKAGPLGDIWRAKQLQYTWLRSLTDEYTPFWQVTAEALDYAMAQLGIDDDELRSSLMEGYRGLDAYADVAPVLERLRAAGHGTAILSNGSKNMLASGVENANLQHLLDHVLSVDDVGIFKPDHRTYQMACDAFGVGPSEICFLSSNGWDAAGAAGFGFQVAWINRAGLPVERLPARPKAIINSMDGLPAVLGLEAV
ncbi:MAG: haloacid dehalogenase type II [Alphaproteobacteria bacterium]|nr:haloacid dehalogenase type II [Alphaproteobacteria bacterium SS10]